MQGMGVKAQGEPSNDEICREEGSPSFGFFCAPLEHEFLAVFSWMHLPKGPFQCSGLANGRNEQKVASASERCKQEMLFLLQKNRSDLVGQTYLGTEVYRRKSCAVVLVCSTNKN